MDQLFSLSGVSMMAHLVLSQLRRLSLKWNSPLALELFAVPNAPLAPDWGFRLLRVRYFRFWRRSPDEMRSEPMLTRLLFVATQISGCAFPVCMLAFLAGAFILARQ